MEIPQQQKPRDKEDAGFQVQAGQESSLPDALNLCFFRLKAVETDLWAKIRLVEETEKKIRIQAAADQALANRSVAADQALAKLGELRRPTSDTMQVTMAL